MGTGAKRARQVVTAHYALRRISHPRQVGEVAAFMAAAAPSLMTASVVMALDQLKKLL